MEEEDRRGRQRERKRRKGNMRSEAGTPYTSSAVDTLVAPGCPISRPYYLKEIALDCLYLYMMISLKIFRPGNRREIC